MGSCERQPEKNSETDIGFPTYSKVLGSLNFVSVFQTKLLCYDERRARKEPRDLTTSRQFQKSQLMPFVGTTFKAYHLFFLKG